MFIPYRCKNPPESLPIGTIALILANTGIYLATSDHGLRIRDEVLQKWAVTGHNFSPLTILSSMFLHADPMHLIGNMLFLYLFGFAVEGRLKTIKFLILYLLAGACGDLLHHVIIGINRPDMPSLGASGAIMGVMGAALWMFPYAKVCFFYVSRFNLSAGPIDWPIWGVACLYTGFDILAAILFPGGDGVGHFAHIGGVAGGILICMLMRPKRDNEQVSEAKATLSEVQDYAVLTRRELEQMHHVQPKNDLVLLHWMQRSIRDLKIEPQCQKAFLDALPRLIRESDNPLPLGTCVIYLAETPEIVKPVLLIELAGRVERAHDPGMAIRLLEKAFADPSATEAEHESCLYKVAMICESHHQNYGRATACYRQIVERWPMSPMADQARARLKVTEARA